VATLAAQTAKADVITFNDLTESPSVDFGGSTRISNVGSTNTTHCASPPAEDCTFDISAPTGYTLSSFLGVTFTTGTPSTYVRIGEQNSPVESDYVFAEALSSTIVFVNFHSDTDGGSPFQCSQSQGGTNSCSLLEDGTLQTAGFILWTKPSADAKSDALKFQSDVEATTPEPKAILLVLAMCLVMAISKHRTVARTQID